MRGIVWLVLLLLILAPRVLAAQPAGEAPGALEVEGATYAELDEGSGLLTLRGSPVTVRRGTMTLRAPAIVYDTKQRMLRASGGAAFADATLSLEAAEATVWIAEDRLQAAGGVVATHGLGPDAIRLRAARLEVLGRDRRAVATGAAEVTSRDATMTADRVEVALARDELIAEGNARLVREDIVGRASRVVVRRAEDIAVLSGGAVVRQGQNEARAETITVDLRRRRFTASGHVSFVLHPGR